MHIRGIVQQRSVFSIQYSQSILGVWAHMFRRQHAALKAPGRHHLMRGGRVASWNSLVSFFGGVIATQFVGVRCFAALRPTRTLYGGTTCTLLAKKASRWGCACLRCPAWWSSISSNSQHFVVVYHAHARISAPTPVHGILTQAVLTRNSPCWQIPISR